MHPTRTTRMPFALLAVAAFLVLGACGSSGGGGKAGPTLAGSTQPPGSATASTTATASTSAPASSAVTTSTTTAPGTPPRCTTRDLAISAGQPAAAAGHQGAPIVWTNKGQRDCLMTGWAGADGLDASGQSIVHATRTDSGYLGGLEQGTRAPELVLRPGDTASSLVEGTSVPTGDQGACPQYAALLVTPPEDTVSVKLDVGLSGCSGLQIHPVVAGPTGRQGH